MTASGELRANLVEVFSAIQGEGAQVGARQIFIRLAGCDLRCHFCDSAHTWHASASCRIEQTPGRRNFEAHSNPVSQGQLLAWVMQQAQPHLHDSISLTGGEPLLQARFLQAFLPEAITIAQLPVYLETGGHRPQALSRLLPLLDTVGMDIKLPSTSGERRWHAHQASLQRCHAAGVTAFVKLIVAERTDPDELAQAARLVASVDPAIEVFLQPVTPLAEPLPAGELAPPAAEQMLTWQAELKRTLARVRVVPQTHKTLGQL